jgi:hypothetical protein
VKRASSKANLAILYFDGTQDVFEIPPYTSIKLLASTEFDLCRLAYLVTVLAAEPSIKGE